MTRKIKILLGCLVIILIGLSYYLYQQPQLGAFPSHVSSGDIITSADWNSMTDAVTDTNSYDIDYTGHLTITSASSTNQTITNLWATNFTPTTLTATNGTITNASTTYGTIPTLWSTKGTITNASTTYATIPTFWGTNGTITNASTTYGTIPTLWSTTGTITTLTVTGGTFANATSSTSLFVPYGTMSLSQGGQVMINSTDENLKWRSPNATQVVSATSTIGFTIASTTASELVSLKYFDQAATLQKVMCNVVGGTSFDFNLRYNADITASGLAVFSSDQSISTTTALYASAMTNNTPVAGDTLWATTSAVVGTVRYAHCTIFYKLNP